MFEEGIEDWVCGQRVVAVLKAADSQAKLDWGGLFTFHKYVYGQFFSTHAIPFFPIGLVLEFVG